MEDVPTTGLSLEQAAERLMPQPATPAEPSEEVEDTTEASEEVVETEELEAEAEETEVPEEGILSIKEWLKDPDVLAKLDIPVKVNGAESSITLSELRDSYQIKEASEQRLNSLKTKQSEFEQEKSKLIQSYNEQLTQAANLVSTLEKQLVGDAENIDWQTLRETDPAEYSAKRLDLENRSRELAQARTAITQEQQTKVREVYENLAKTESEKLIERIPEWSNEEVANKEKAEIRDYLLDNGFSPVEVDGKVDANGNIQQIGIIKASAIEMARKAMLYDRGEKQVEVTKKKVKKLPKVTKPGRPPSSSEVDVEKVKKMKGRLKQTGRLDDAAMLIHERLGGL